MPLANAQSFKRASLLLFLLVLSFATLVPGGPVETRDFSGLSGLTFWGFNAFLIGLGVLALVSAFGLRQGAPAAAWGAIIASIGYVFVVLLDLGHVFPHSPDPIPLALGLIEIADLILAGYVLVLCHKGLGHI